jgi:hypothetical protein
LALVLAAADRAGIPTIKIRIKFPPPNIIPSIKRSFY